MVLVERLILVRKYKNLKIFIMSQNNLIGIIQIIRMNDIKITDCDKIEFIWRDKIILEILNSFSNKIQSILIFTRLKFTSYQKYIF